MRSRNVSILSLVLGTAALIAIGPASPAHAADVDIDVQVQTPLVDLLGDCRITDLIGGNYDCVLP
ncbi:hypothetical protein HS041_36065 [Planomonospora sp. ID67723]|uniref:hypothetical protein n=1 Tax=Planomonospora sp. ID67723 TaxID=2738134 RepID=UPI0018C35ABA|nr:hypothetical protein [Planomonospora sp. ID67723]MBG0833123.1 hypothetical protein [Planomonospora sp. ID67723]